LVSGTLAVRCERGRGVDPELSEHGGDIRGRGGRSDRSRTKDGGDGVDGLQGGKVDDGDWDRNRGVVTDLQGPPSERMPEDKVRDLKACAQQYARDLGSCDDTQISYLEFLESEVEDDLTLARVIAG
jgi:hypothetical protein